MADFQVKKMPDGPVLGTTGIVEVNKRMFGDAGAAATGKSSWHRSIGYWKTFHLYALDRLAATGVGAAVVEIHGCMELPDDPDDHDVAAYELLATLNTTTKSFSTENPWRYVRAVVTTQAAFAVQVGLCEQGG